MSHKIYAILLSMIVFSAFAVELPAIEPQGPWQEVPALPAPTGVETGTSRNGDASRNGDGASFDPRKELENIPLKKITAGIAEERRGKFLNKFLCVSLRTLRLAQIPDRDLAYMNA